MKKRKLIIGALAMVVAIGGAYAFKVNNTLPGDLWYFNAQKFCVRAPCEIWNNTNNPCPNAPLYSDENCMIVYHPQAWVTDGGK